MNFVDERVITSADASSDNYMPVINIDKTQTKRLVQLIGKCNMDKQLLTDINILGQNISSIDTKDYSYEHLGEKLQFSDLSRGEKVFLVSLASKYTNTPIYLQYDVLQLTKTSMRKYHKLFNECNCINIIYSSEDILNYLQSVMQGEIL